MKTRFQFSHDRLRVLPPAPQGQRATYHDTKLPVLKCIVSDKGTKSLQIVAKIAGRTRRRVVHRLRGAELDPSLKSLRLRAREIYMEMISGTEPPPRRQVPTFREYVAIWADSAEMLNAGPGWRRDKLAAVRNHCGPLMEIRLDEISRADVRRLLTDLNSRYARVASVVRSIIHQIYELAIDEEVLPEEYPVPVPRRLRLKRHKRERRLTQDELARLWQALESYRGHETADPLSIRLIVLMALLTAQRRGNILRMRWDEVDQQARLWIIPSTKTKTRREYRIPLHDVVWDALQVQRRNLFSRGLSGDWVFPSLIVPDQPLTDLKKPWAWLMERAAIENFRFHDLRHTAASIAYEASQDLKGTQLFLQHQDLRTTADRYINTVDTAPQERASGAVLSALCKAAGVESCSVAQMGLEATGSTGHSA